VKDRPQYRRFITPIRTKNSHNIAWSGTKIDAVDNAMSIDVYTQVIDNKLRTFNHLSVSRHYDAREKERMGRRLRR